MGLFDSEKVERLEGEVARLERELALAQSVGRVADLVTVEITTQLESGQLKEGAEAMALASVAAQEHDHIVQEQAADLLATHGDQYRADYRRKQGPAERQRL